MSRSYSYMPRSPPRRNRLQTLDSSRTSSFRLQAPAQQDINIDDFGDMGSDEDEFQTLGSSFMPPKPPAQPQYNLVPYGFLRDDDELAEEDYDGVPIDDTVLQDSPPKRPWDSSPCKPQSQEIRGNPITVLGSGNQGGPHFPKWPSDTRSQDVATRNRPGLGSSSVGRATCRWDKKTEPLSISSSGNNRSIPSLMEIDSNVGKVQSFVRGSDDSNSLLKTINKPTLGNTKSLVRSADYSNPTVRGGGKQSLSGCATSFVSAKNISSTSLRSHDNTLCWNDKPKPFQSSTPAWSEQDSGLSPSLKGLMQTGQNPMFTPTNVANTSSQLEMVQAAALQQALTGLTQLGPQPGLNLLGAQNLLMQASQNPTLAAALVASGGIFDAGLSSLQPNTSNNHTVESLLKSTVTTAVPDISQSNLGLLTYPLRSKIKGNGSTSREKAIPDGTGSTRHSEPDISSLVFDPSTGYRFDASTGLHYDANSGYFFNSKLKIYLRWDKFTQTYLKVDNPSGVPCFIDSSTERMSYIADSCLASQDKVQQSSTFSTSNFAKESHQRLDALMEPNSRFQKEINTVHPPISTINTLIGVPGSSYQKERNNVQPLLSAIPADFSKPPPSLPHTLYSDSGFLHSGKNPPNAAEQKVAEQKAAALPNYAETSLFNKLRKAKLAQTAQAKSDRKQWGSPDPLLEAARKHAAEVDKSQEDALNLNEILQRSRQFMKQKTGEMLDASDDTADRLMGKGRSGSHSGDQRKFGSRYRAIGRQRRSQSSERLGNRRGKPSTSPQQPRSLARSPEDRLHGRPGSKARSPNRRGRKRSNPSPARNRMPASRSRSPYKRAQGRVSLSPESRRRRSPSRARSPSTLAQGRAVPLPETRKRRTASRGRSPVKRKGKSSMSPGPRQGRPISRGRGTERRSRGKRSISQELKKIHLHSRTPDKSLKRSLSPKVKVVLDQSPGGSKIRVCSPERINKRLAERGLSAERSKVRRRLSLSYVEANIRSPERTQTSVENKTGLASQRLARERLDIHGNRNESSKKDTITELKPIPYDTPQCSGKTSSGKGKDVSGYKSLSNLRNQGMDKPREKKTVREQDKSRQHKDKCATSKPSIEVDLTTDSDNEQQSRENKGNCPTGRSSTEVDLTVDSEDDKQSRANHRLVSERTFSCVWERKKPDPISPKSSTKKTDTKAEHLSVEDVNNTIDGKDTNKKEETDLEDLYEFDFLAETLDDDKESTVIDEYEEILDYQDLDEATELVEKEPASIQIERDVPRVAESLCKESIETPVIDLYIDLEEPTINRTSKSLLESTQCSSDQAESELVEIPSEKSGSLGNGAGVSQLEENADAMLDTKLGHEEDADAMLDKELGHEEDADAMLDKELGNEEDADAMLDKELGHEEDADVMLDKELGHEDIDGVESCQMEVVNESLDDSARVHDPESLEGHSVVCKEIKTPDTPVVENCETSGSSKSHDMPTVQDGTSEVRPETEEDGEESNKMDNTANEMIDEPNGRVDDSESDMHACNELLDKGEWNVVDSVDDNEEVTKQNIPTNSSEFSHNDEKLKDIEKANVSLAKLRTSSGTQEVKDYRSDITQNSGETGSKDDALNSQCKNDELSLQANNDSQVGKDGENNVKPDTQVSNEDGRNDNPPLQGDGPSKEIISQSDVEEPLPQVRSVSDIEKFLLLSSQEVEAKREQGIEQAASKNEKKKGVFSRLGEKLPTDEAGGEPKVVLELPAETAVLSAGPSKNVSASAPSESKSSIVKPFGASVVPKKSNKASPEDPVGKLFDDNKPTSQILIGPMNFIEPLQNFQHFTQKYMQRMLLQERVKFKQVYVCHEDVTGAPYHYVLILFHSKKLASDYFKKHKGRFKCNEKLFGQISGHTKQKLIPGCEVNMHFTDNNWVCRVCKKGNFPLRSLCFGCFQHKDPKGFSPLTILDKTPPPWKPSKFVGTPKLKFFATKEKIIESSPPLDGFDIKNIEMIMDEKMGFPAGICVFEMSNSIDACKLKKFFNRRDIEAVSVEMNDNSNSLSPKTGPRIVPSRKTPPKESTHERLHKTSRAVSVFESDTHKHNAYQGGRETGEISSRIPPREAQVPKGRSRSPTRESRVPRRRPPTPSREVRVPRECPSTPPRDVRAPRRRSPPPSREARVPIRRSPSSSCQVRLPMGRSPGPLRSRLSRDRARSRSPRRHSPVYRPISRSPRLVSQVYENDPFPSSGSRSVRKTSRSYTDREVSPIYRSRERLSGYRSPVPSRSPGYQSPLRYRSRSPINDTPRRRSPSPRYRSLSPVRPTKPDGRGDWRYPLPDPTNFRFEPKSGLDYDPTTTLYYEPKSCCFYNDDTNEWLEYDPRTGRYVVVC